MDLQSINHQMLNKRQKKTSEKAVGFLRAGARKKTFFFSVSEKQRVIQGVATCGDEPKNSLEV